jgi:hypothetical protein
MEAIKQNGRALKFASAELKGDREIVIAAVAQDSIALNYTSSPSLKTGGLRSYLEGVMSTTFNVSKHTFIATILFAAKATPLPDEENGGEDKASSSSSSSGGSAGGSLSRRRRLCDNSECPMSLLQPSTVLPGPLSTVVKRLIWDFAGVRSGLGANGPRWLKLKAAAENLGYLCGE